MSEQSNEVEGNICSIAGVFYQQMHGIQPFGGYFLKDFPLERRTFKGYMGDEFGNAVIKGSYISDEEIQFQKLYQNGRLPIDYRFKFDKDKHLWLGEYSGKYSGSGRAICEIHPVIKGLAIKLGVMGPEEQASLLVQSMVDEGSLVETKNPNTGEVLLGLGRDPRDDFDPDDISF